MRPVKMIAIGLLAWPAAEIVAFIVVATLVGVPIALLLVILISLAGLLILRRFGGFARWRTAGGSAGVATVTLDGTGIATGVGAILLVIPGFITGLLGALILFPTSRRWLSAGWQRLSTPGRQPSAHGTIDLAPDEWRPLSDPTLPPQGSAQGLDRPSPDNEQSAPTRDHVRKRRIGRVLIWRH
ncbi:MAG TPA: FxsA family protein [Xanthobacteraceae bacterium]|nr:FxsA family protein [Xanthobacteraceae bacterium]